MSDVNLDDLKASLEEAGVTEDRAQEVLSLFTQKQEIYKSTSVGMSAGSPDAVAMVMALQLREEKDWRKRAAIAAQLASINLTRF